MAAIPCVKVLAESPSLSSLPSTHTFPTRQLDHESDPDSENSIPIIDFSLLNSSSPEQRSKIVHDLGKACQEWGFFVVINHGVAESVMTEMVDACERFFDLTEQEKREYEGKNVFDPVRCGTSFNASVDKVLFWRDFLNVFVHPQFNSPAKPPGFSGITEEYCKRTGEVARELLKGISESLGLEACYIEKSMNLDSGFEVLAVNLYPPCPQPDFAMGLPPHSDQGLLTLLTQNGVGGLQLQRNGKWVNVNAPPFSFLCNLGDHIEILTNGKYPSVLHRAVVNNTKKRISVVLALGPSFETVVSPAQELMDREGRAPAFIAMNYKEYYEMQQTNQLENKSCLDRLRI